MPKSNLEYVIYGLRRFLTGRVKEKTELSRLSQDHTICSSLVVQRDGNSGRVAHSYETKSSRRASFSGTVFYVDVHEFDEESIATDQSLTQALATVARNYRTDFQYFNSQRCTISFFDVVDCGKPLSTRELCQEIYPAVFSVALP